VRGCGAGGRGSCAASFAAARRADCGDAGGAVTLPDGAASRRAGAAGSERGCGAADGSAVLQRGRQCFCASEGAAEWLLRTGFLRGGRSFCATHRGLEDTMRLLEIDSLSLSRSDLRPGQPRGVSDDKND
jgi:hypothetical protein